jgi:hypothetical protein
VDFDPFRLRCLTPGIGPKKGKKESARIAKFSLDFGSSLSGHGVGTIGPVTGAEPYLNRASGVPDTINAKEVSDNLG